MYIPLKLLRYRGLPECAIVAVRQGKLLALAFHPELSSDTRLHRYFLEIVDGYLIEGKKKAGDKATIPTD